MKNSIDLNTLQPGRQKTYTQITTAIQNNQKQSQMLIEKMAVTQKNIDEYENDDDKWCAEFCHYPELDEWYKTLNVDMKRLGLLRQESERLQVELRSYALTSFCLEYYLLRKQKSPHPLTAIPPEIIHHMMENEKTHAYKS